MSKKTDGEIADEISRLTAQLSRRALSRLEMTVRLAKYQGRMQTSATGRKRAALDVAFAAAVLGVEDTF